VCRLLAGEHGDDAALAACDPQRFSAGSATTAVAAADAVLS
jgi:hypothetical protein